MIIAISVVLFVGAVVAFLIWDAREEERRRREQQDLHNQIASAWMRSGAAVAQDEARSNLARPASTMFADHHEAAAHARDRRRHAAARDLTDDVADLAGADLSRRDDASGFGWNSFNTPTPIHADTPVPHAHTSFSDMFTGGHSGGAGVDSSWSSGDSGGSSCDSGGADSGGGDCGGGDGGGGGGD